MTLRKTTVRDADGTLYVIPNSQITTVANLSVGYSVATVNVSVDFSANPDAVTKLLKEIAMDVRNSDEFREVFWTTRRFWAWTREGLTDDLSRGLQDPRHSAIRAGARVPAAGAAGSGRESSAAGRPEPGLPASRRCGSGAVRLGGLKRRRRRRAIRRRIKPAGEQSVQRGVT